LLERIRLIPDRQGLAEYAIQPTVPLKAIGSVCQRGDV
jgi:hypothetical protein